MPCTCGHAAEVSCEGNVEHWHQNMAPRRREQGSVGQTASVGGKHAWAARTALAVCGSVPGEHNAPIPRCSPQVGGRFWGDLGAADTAWHEAHFLGLQARADAKSPVYTPLEQVAWTARRPLQERCKACPPRGIAPLPPALSAAPTPSLAAEQEEAAVDCSWRVQIAPWCACLVQQPLARASKSEG